MWNTRVCLPLCIISCCWFKGNCQALQYRLLFLTFTSKTKNWLLKVTALVMRIALHSQWMTSALLAKKIQVNIEPFVKHMLKLNNLFIFSRLIEHLYHCSCLDYDIQMISDLLQYISQLIVTLNNEVELNTFHVISQVQSIVHVILLRHKVPLFCTSHNSLSMMPTLPRITLSCSKMLVGCQMFYVLRSTCHLLFPLLPSTDMKNRFVLTI